MAEEGISQEGTTVGEASSLEDTDLEGAVGKDCIAITMVGTALEVGTLQELGIAPKEHRTAAEEGNSQEVSSHVRQASEASKRLEQEAAVQGSNLEGLNTQANHTKA